MPAPGATCKQAATFTKEFSLNDSLSSTKCDLRDPPA